MADCSFLLPAAKKHSGQKCHNWSGSSHTITSSNSSFSSIPDRTSDLSEKLERYQAEGRMPWGEWSSSSRLLSMFHILSTTVMTLPLRPAKPHTCTNCCKSTSPYSSTCSFSPFWNEVQCPLRYLLAFPPLHLAPKKKNPIAFFKFLSQGRLMLGIQVLHASLIREAFPKRLLAVAFEMENSSLLPLLLCFPCSISRLF